MPDRTRKRISRRVRHTTVHGLGAVLFGFLFLTVSIAVVLFSAGIIRSNPMFQQSLPLRWFAGSSGCLFAACSGLAVIEGLRIMLWRWRRTRILASNPGADWLADYRWNQKGTADRVLWKAIGTLLGVIVASTFLVPSTYFIFHSDMQEGFQWDVGISMFGIALFDAFALGFLARAGYLLLRWYKYGSGFLVFNRFPFFLGESLEASFRSSQTLTECPSFEATLRCIKELHETTASAHGRREEKVVCYQVYADTIRIGGVNERGFAGRSVSVSFSLPVDEQPTKLADKLSVYWEVIIMANTPGIDYKGIFLVPVYQRI